jgi:GntP family gluconate:H+ symporter
MSTEAWRISIGLMVSVGGIILATRYLKLSAFFSLLIAAVCYGLIAGLNIGEILPVLQRGFGSLLQQIGIIVAFGAVLGILLEKTGAMESISTGILSMFGAKRSLISVGLIGMLVGIPVFCDSGFIILSRLIPSLALKTATAPASFTLALSSGLYTTHTLVPPTPGPLAAASNIGAGDHLGIVILIGLMGALPVLLVSYFFSKSVGKKIISTLDLTITPQIVRKVPLTKALMPILLPILLIATASFIKLSAAPDAVVTAFTLLGTPIVALFIGILFALMLVRKTDKDLPKWIGEALKDAGIILLITGAGGAFGAVIKSSGVDKLISEFSTSSKLHPVVILSLAWMLSAILKTAQGSTTSALIIASSLIAPVAMDFTSPVEMGLLVLALGGGSMCMSHANDSYFWVVSQFGGLSAQDAFSSYTILTLLQGIMVLITAILLHFIL